MHTLVDAEKIFKTYNNHRLGTLLRSYNSQQQKTILVLPLLFHTNISMFPGYISEHTPSVIENYQPDVASLKIAHGLNRSFSYDEETMTDDSSIISIQAQERIISGEKLLWILHQPSLENKDIKLLEKKSRIIEKWLRKQGIHFKIIVSRDSEVAYNYYSSHNYKYHIDKTFFLDSFYAESILLAGKPVNYWFSEQEPVTPDDSHIDCGKLYKPGIKDYMSACIWHLYNVINQPVTSYISLSIIDHHITNGDHVFFSNILKQAIYEHHDPESININSMYYEYLSRLISNKSMTHIQKLIQISRYSSSKASNQQNVKDQSINSINIDDLFLQNKASMNYIYAASEQTFRRIKIYLNLSGYSYDQISHNLRSITSGLISRLFSSENKMIITNKSSRFTLDRATYQHSIINHRQSWSLLHNKTVLHTCDDLIDLTCWAFINQLIDTSTQISIQHPDYSVRQIDILEIVKTLARNININQLNNIDINNFIEEPVPVKSVMFIGHKTKDSREASINHLLVYNTGEIYSYRYKNLHNFNNWHKSHPEQHIVACLYGSWANEHRELDRRILNNADNVSLY